MPTHTGGMIQDPVIEGLVLLAVFIGILIVGAVGISIIDAFFNSIVRHEAEKNNEEPPEDVHSKGPLIFICVVVVIAGAIWAFFDPT